MEVTTRELNILTIALTMFYDEVCKTGTTEQMKADIKTLSKKVSEEYFTPAPR
jgi:hypothetical protein